MNDAGQERRAADRHRDSSGHGMMAVRVRPGHRADLIDVSECGALVETTHRLIPGAPVELQIETAAGLTSVRGRVVRCIVSKLFPAAVWYRGAVQFDRHLPWQLDPRGNTLPATERDARRHTRVDATRDVV